MAPSSQSSISPHQRFCRYQPSFTSNSCWQDASWVLPSSSLLKCTSESPLDVYILSKSSDFVSHDLDVECDTVFEGCQCDSSSPSSYQLEFMVSRDP
ncbi:hypothetical protein BDR03DRAFT_322660 [Suillus americanus]|nr:hypothetical protein BDR03DRAFT_322660 [Suillus americanus]